MTCIFCNMATDDEVPLDTERHGAIRACIGCLRELADERLDERDQYTRSYCSACQHYTAGGYCTQGLTPLTCC